VIGYPVFSSKVLSLNHKVFGETFPIAVSDVHNDFICVLTKVK